MPPRRGLAVLLVAAVLATGCAQLPTEGTVGVAEQPAPLEAVPETACPPEPSDTAWTWRVDAQRTGALPCRSVPDQVQVHRAVRGINKDAHTAAKASPVPLDGDWLVPGDTGILARYSPGATVQWSAATWPSSHGLHGTPVVHAGTAYVGAYDGALYAFDAASGELEWRTVLGGSIGASPLYHDGEIYVSVETPTPSGLVSIVNATTGEEVFRDERVTDHPHSSIALDEEADVFTVGANDGNLYAWNLTPREHAWTFETGDAIKGPIAIHDGAAFAGSWDDHLYRVDLATGEEDWRFETEDNVMAGPAIDARTGTVLVGSFDDKVYALDADTGELRWATRLGGPVLSSPVVTQEKVLVGSYDEHLYALELRTGEIVWSYEANGRVTSSAVVQDGKVAFTERADEANGRLYVLEAAG